VRRIKIMIVLTSVGIFILPGIILINSTVAYGQSKESGRDPFLLPSGVHLLSNKDTSMGTKGIPSKLAGNPSDVLPSPLKVKAILISDRFRLALIDRHIVTAGDSIQDEKVLEIEKDRVILGKGDRKRTLLLSQSPVLLTVEEKKGEKR
jgi:hypothetical protein